MSLAHPHFVRRSMLGDSVPEQSRRLSELEAELATQKTESALKIRALRQEYERVKTGLQKQLQRFGGGLKGGSVTGVPAAAVGGRGWRKDRGVRGGDGATVRQGSQ